MKDKKPLNIVDFIPLIAVFLAAFIKKSPFYVIIILAIICTAFILYRLVDQLKSEIAFKILIIDLVLISSLLTYFYGNDKYKCQENTHSFIIFSLITLIAIICMIVNLDRREESNSAFRINFGIIGLISTLILAFISLSTVGYYDFYKDCKFETKFNFDKSEISEQNSNSKIEDKTSFKEDKHANQKENQSSKQDSLNLIDSLYNQRIVGKPSRPSNPVQPDPIRQTGKLVIPSRDTANLGFSHGEETINSLSKLRELLNIHHSVQVQLSRSFLIQNSGDLCSVGTTIRVSNISYNNSHDAYLITFRRTQ